MTSRRKLNINKPYKVAVQTEDKSTPSSITIKLITYLTPTIEDDYTKRVLRLSKRLKSTLYKNINKSTFDANRTILFIDTADISMKLNKPSYAQVNVVLYQNKPYHQMHSEFMMNELNEISNLIMNELELNETFKFNKTKTPNQ